MLLVDKWNYILYFRDKLLDQLQFESPREIILDIGCGRRGWLSLLLKGYYGVKLVTTDIAREKVLVAKHIAKSVGAESDSYVVADCRQLPFVDGAFDKIVGNAILHHVLDCIEEAGSEISRTLKCEGEGLFTGEIVACSIICWMVRKLILSKGKAKLDNEGICTCHNWKNKLSHAGFKKVHVRREQRAGYVAPLLKAAYYSLVKRLPEKLCVNYLLTSCTIALKK